RRPRREEWNFLRLARTAIDDGATREPAHNADRACLDVPEARSDDARDDYEDTDEDCGYQVEACHGRGSAMVIARRRVEALWADGDSRSPTRPARSRAEIRDRATIASIVDRLDAGPLTGSHLPRCRAFRRVQRRQQLDDLPVELHRDETVAVRVEARDGASLIAHDALERLRGCRREAEQESPQRGDQPPLEEQAGT